MKKGFTLVELLAVMILLGIISLIAIPSIGKMLIRSRENAYESTKNELIKAAKKYAAEHTGELPVREWNSVEKCLSINDIVKNGYINEDEVIDPRTEETMIGFIKITYDASYKQYVYEYKEECNILDLSSENVIFNTSNVAQTYVVPKTGKYKIELWGARGGATSKNSTYAGYGGYTSGIIELKANTKLYFYVGSTTDSKSPGFNGGGSGCISNNVQGLGGGGATDVRLISGAWDNENGLRSRIMVAGGGGGTNLWYSTAPLSGGGIVEYLRGGFGGGLNGGPGYRYDGSRLVGDFAGGTQTNGFAFGKGGNAIAPTSLAGWGAEGRGGGGGGYYGGIAQTADGSFSNAAGGGGSSYISGHTGCVAVSSETSSLPKSGCTNGTTNNDCSIHYSGKFFTSTIIKNGSEVMPDSNGGTMTGNSGDGKAKISYIGE